MGLYAIGDLHLHFTAECKSRPQLKDRLWRNHEEKFKKNCEKLLTAEDTLILAGDHSWGKNLQECEADFAYIESLPGRKILGRGNHDQFWDAKKTETLNGHFAGRLHFLQNNFYAYRDCAVVGTKGFTFEGPFYLNGRGQIIGWDEEAEEHAKKLVIRELERLRLSFEAAKAEGYRRFVMILHYPPTNILEKESGFTRMAEEYGTEQVVYGHCHGSTRFFDSLQGELHGVRYSLVSGDYLRWKPLKLMD